MWSVSITEPKIDRINGISPDQQALSPAQYAKQDEEILIFSDDDKKIKQEVNGQERDIRIGHDSQGDKFRYTDDTHEILITVSSEGKNTYITQSEFNKMVKNITHTDTLPEGVSAEFVNGHIVFKKDGEQLSGSKLKNS